MRALLDQEPFYLFGMGTRRKMIFRNHCLFGLEDHRVLACFDETQPVRIRPGDYRVEIGEDAVWEDETGVHMRRQGAETLLTDGAVCLPDFEGYPHAAWMRALHADILVSIVDGKPLPNPLVYARPWYRDAAMMCMVLQRTGNLHLVKDWILSLDTPYDRNNKGCEEPDNLGQALYMISLASDARHPLVKTIIGEAQRRTENGHLTGLSDYAPHPVYQTKWLKYGLACLGLADSWTVPDTEDDYAELFWMDGGQAHASAQKVSYGDDLYPYLSVARAHHRGAPLAETAPAAGEYPMTWEKEASEAAYDRNLPFLPHYAAAHVGAPHTWHAAELFLYLYDRCGEGRPEEVVSCRDMPAGSSFIRKNTSR